MIVRWALRAHAERRVNETLLSTLASDHVIRVEESSRDASIRVGTSLLRPPASKAPPYGFRQHHFTRLRYATNAASSASAKRATISDRSDALTINGGASRM